MLVFLWVMISVVWPTVAQNFADKHRERLLATPTAPAP